MSQFTPDVGTLYYVSSKIRIHRGGAFDSMLAGTPVKEEVFFDRSYQDRIFRCVAVDDRAIVGEIVHGYSHGGKPLMLLRKDYDMFPVGPDVAKALGVNDAAEIGAKP